MNETINLKAYSILNIFMGAFFLATVILTFFFRSLYGDFYLLTLIPGIMGISLIFMGSYSYLRKRIFKNIKIFIGIVAIFLASEILLAIFAIRFIRLSIIEIVAYFSLFSVLCVFYLLSGYYCAL